MQTDSPSIEEIASWFDNPNAVLKDLREAQGILEAIYQTHSYNGEWRVVYIDKNGEQQVQEGSHCSCNGPTW